MDRSLQECVALASGGVPASIVEAWPRLFERCVTERCVALVWLRSESFIRSAAPADLVAQWESWVAAHRERVRCQIASLTQVNEWLTAHGIRPVVLKGIPLSLRLYGDNGARAINDIDLYVMAAECHAASNILSATGWRLLRGAPPADMEFVKNVDGTMTMLELHATLAGPWHCELPFPSPESARLVVDGSDMTVMSGSFLPAYLSSHLLQHGERPLLWLLDFKTLWDASDPTERAAAFVAARAARLSRVLRLVERWVALLPEVAAGELEATRRLQDEVLRPGPTRGFSQIVASGATARDLIGFVSQLLSPRELRHQRGSPLRMWARRIGRRLRGRSAAPELSVPGAAAAPATPRARS